MGGPLTRRRAQIAALLAGAQLLVALGLPLAVSLATRPPPGPSCCAGNGCGCGTGRGCDVEGCCEHPPGLGGAPHCRPASGVEEPGELYLDAGREISEGAPAAPERPRLGVIPLSEIDPEVLRAAGAAATRGRIGAPNPLACCASRGRPAPPARSHAAAATARPDEPRSATETPLPAPRGFWKGFCCTGDPEYPLSTTRRSEPLPPLPEEDESVPALRATRPPRPSDEGAPSRRPEVPEPVPIRS